MSANPPRKLFLILIPLILVIGIVCALVLNPFRTTPPRDSVTPVEAPTIIPTLSPSPTATPTPKPLSFAEMNQLYGPCVSLPVLMYHHVQEREIAQSGGYTALTVNPASFKSHLDYLNAKGYTTISPVDLANFFDSGAPLPKKPVLLTFDDGYEDFGSVIAPLLNQYNMKGTLFVSTGLMDNHNYLLWTTIDGLKSHSNLYFANHTWSHHGMTNSLDLVTKEIGTADRVLTEKGLDPNKIFAYPYGTVSQTAITYLRDHAYRLAFTTEHGFTECKKQRFTLPRIRIGNGSLSAYGL